jgi:hypothetical protein
MKHVWLGQYGGSSPKPTKLISNARWVFELDSTKPANRRQWLQTTTRRRDAAGKVQVTGTKQLKSTQPTPQWRPKADPNIAGIQF